MLPFTLLLFAFTSLTTADLPPYQNDAAFEDAAYGPYPVQRFQSSPELAPRPNILRKHPDPDHSLYTFFEPRGWKVDRPGPMIVDADWNLIWTSPKWGNSYNFQVQTFKGVDYLTFWAGDDGIGGHGEGYMYMLDETYKTVKAFGAKNGMMADQHGFQFTEKGTVIYTIYETRKADLSSVSDIGDGYIWDCLFQEVDFETNKLLFEWRATEHIPFTDTFGPPRVASYWEPWDWFHLNSVDKDSEGNYLVSARYTHALHYICKDTGAVLWTLGGKHSNFTDLSNGHATDFCYQHDARWSADNTRISLFDNHADNAHPTLGDTRGLMLTVNTHSTPMTVQIACEYYSPKRMSCLSQGAMQILDNGDVFIGWGYCGAYTLFAADGTPLEDVHTGPQSEYILGNIQSYRARKHRWKAFPKTKPSIAINGSSVFVSWNGATEVKSWELQGTGHTWWVGEADWQRVDAKQRQGFETQLDFEEESTSKYLRVVALDADGKRLGATKTIDRYFTQTALARALTLTDISSLLILVTSSVVGGYVLYRILEHWLRRVITANTSMTLKTRAWRRRRSLNRLPLTQPGYSPLPFGDEDEAGLPVKES